MNKPEQPEAIRYGAHASQFAERWMPLGEGRAGAVALLHGGWWRQMHSLRLMDPLVQDLVGRGHQVWNMEYRRIDAPGSDGGWPTTFDDVRVGLEILLETTSIAPSSVIAVGHSAGGQLGLLAGADLGLGGVIAQAPITDLAACAAAGLGEEATPLFMGGNPASVPMAYRHASPLERLPIGCPQLVVHGTDDVRVPIEHSRRYVAEAQRSSDHVELIEVAGGDHMFVLDPTHEYWRRAVSWIDARC